jgi:ABC-type dipeptide/oligopeptide/nickel transport system ATPase component
MNSNILEVEDLKVSFMTNEGTVTVVKEISFDVKLGETLGIVGESGSGKSVTSLSIMGLIQSPPGIVTGKRIDFAGQDILQLSEQQMQKIRGNQIGIIFQEPMTSLNPIHTCGKQIMEPLLIHKNMTKKEAKAKAMDMLKKVGIPNPEQRFNEYPHQMSGGMRQRIMIAMALVCQPQLLIADEPTTALDVTIQAQILELIKQLKDEINAGIIMITHDLGVVAEVCDKVIVMYAGEIMEQAPVKELFRNPLHPYTRD